MWCCSGVSDVNHWPHGWLPIRALNLSQWVGFLTPFREYSLHNLAHLFLSRLNVRHHWQSRWLIWVSALLYVPLTKPSPQMEYVQNNALLRWINYIHWVKSSTLKVSLSLFWCLLMGFRFRFAQVCYQAHRFVSKEVNDEQDMFFEAPVGRARGAVAFLQAACHNVLPICHFYVSRLFQEEVSHVCMSRELNKHQHLSFLTGQGNRSSPRLCVWRNECLLRGSS